MESKMGDEIRMHECYCGRLLDLFYQKACCDHFFTCTLFQEFRKKDLESIDGLLKEAKDQDDMLLLKMLFMRSWQNSNVMKPEKFTGDRGPADIQFSSSDSQSESISQKLLKLHPSLNQVSTNKPTQKSIKIASGGPIMPEDQNQKMSEEGFTIVQPDLDNNQMLEENFDFGDIPNEDMGGIDMYDSGFQEGEPCNHCAKRFTMDLMFFNDGCPHMVSKNCVMERVTAHLKNKQSQGGINCPVQDCEYLFSDLD
jgi:hypothetical protein